MGKKYTAEDFANAKFAEHPDGRIAVRFNIYPDFPWTFNKGADTDEYRDVGMAHNGWVPVPTKPTLTDSEVGELVPIELPEEYVTGFIDGFEKAGGTIIPDPEPTDEELLAGIIRNIDDWQSITSPELLAKYLNTAGVTPPKEDK